MESLDLYPLSETYHRKLANTSVSFMRYLHDEINWQSPLIGIKGARGVGKTTMLLQHILTTFAKIDEAFYVSLDDLWFEQHTLVELADYLYNRGVKHLYLDEVHKYPQWARTLKNLYDNYPGLHIVYTGSSLVAIDHSVSDLSRRQSLYHLRGMSFREYLDYEGLLTRQPALTVGQLIEGHVEMAMDVSRQLPVLKYFDQYLQHGYYPFYKEAGDDYLMRLREVTKLVLEVDVPSIDDIAYVTLGKLRALLMVIAPNVPLEPNISRLCQQLSTTRDSCLRMLDILERAQLVMLLGQRMRDYKHLVKPQKIYLDNPNLMHALSDTVSASTLRETFFANQTSAVAEVTLAPKGDFCINDKYIFEVGGKGKTYDQIADMPNGYLAVDDTVTGSGHRIPLWMFGLLY